MSATKIGSLPLKGAGGEPVDFARTVLSHGIASLPPMNVDSQGRWFEVTLNVPPRGARTVRVEARGGRAFVSTIGGRAPGDRSRASLLEAVRTILALDEDMSPFYEALREDYDLSWVAAGAGRMIRGATVFEDVVKTICTTNCSWAATVKMVTALVENLGTRAADGRRSFPSPTAMAGAGEDFYRTVMRAVYRGPYFIALARSVDSGDLDLEMLRTVSRDEMNDDEVKDLLLALPGVGPYAAAHIMMLLGRHTNLILDSWTRPTYARLAGRKTVKDSTIVRRFARYGPYAGLAFWMFVTQDWIEEPATT